MSFEKADLPFGEQQRKGLVINMGQGSSGSRETLKEKKNRSSLRHTYYRSFLLLVVIPLILVFLVAEIVIGYQIRRASIATIDALQENIATTLRNDVRNSALQLSHFVYVNDGEFTQAAVAAHNSTGSSWYDSDHALWHKDVSGNRILGYGGDFGDRQSDYAFSGNGTGLFWKKWTGPTPSLPLPTPPSS